MQFCETSHMLYRGNSEVCTLVVHSHLVGAPSVHLLVITKFISFIGKYVTFPAKHYSFTWLMNNKWINDTYGK